MNSPAMTQGEVAHLLPFRVNGSLSETEARAVQEALAESRALREQEQSLDALRREIRAMGAPVSPGERGLARLNRAISADGKRADPVRRWLPKVGIAAALVGLAAAGALMLRSNNGPGGSDFYQQASGEAGDGQLIVGFESTATQADVEALLLRHDLRIVDGPSALGLYQLQTQDGQGLAEALAALRAADTIVETVEPAE